LIQNLKMYGPPIFYAVLILIISSIPSLDLNTGFSYQDKVAHLLEYSIFGVLIQRALQYGKSGDFRWYLTGMGIGVIYGAFDEIHQIWVPGREAEIGDFAADFAGFIIGQGLFFIQNRSRLFRR